MSGVQGSGERGVSRQMGLGARRGIGAIVSHRQGTRFRLSPPGSVVRRARLRRLGTDTGRGSVDLLRPGQVPAGGWERGEGWGETTWDAEVSGRVILPTPCTEARV